MLKGLDSSSPWVCDCMEDDAEDCAEDRMMLDPCECFCHRDDFEVIE